MNKEIFKNLIINKIDVINSEYDYFVKDEKNLDQINIMSQQKMSMNMVLEELLKELEEVGE